MMSMSFVRMMNWNMEFGDVMGGTGRLIRGIGLKLIRASQPRGMVSQRASLNFRPSFATHTENHPPQNATFHGSRFPRIASIGTCHGSFSFFGRRRARRFARRCRGSGSGSGSEHNARRSLVVCCPRLFCFARRRQRQDDCRCSLEREKESRGWWVLAEGAKNTVVRTGQGPWIGLTDLSRVFAPLPSPIPMFLSPAPLAEYKSSSLSPTKRTQLVDHLVSSLAIEAAATEEILFPVLQDLVNEAKTTADDQAVKKEGKGDVKNVFVGVTFLEFRGRVWKTGELIPNHST